MKASLSRSERAVLISVAVACVGLTPTSEAHAAVVDYIQVDSFEAGPDCSVPLACPAQSGGKSCISGRLASAASADPLRAAFQPELACGAGAVGGPCDLSLTPYDALAFASDPVGAIPLTSAEKVVDGCGRFRISGMTTPGLGFVVVVTEDLDNAAENDLHVPGAVARPISQNQGIDDATAIVVRRDTVARWTLTAGAPFGENTFADVGALLLQFRVAGVPRPGVTALRNGSAVVASDYYFTDLAPGDRLRTAGVPDSTGANGSALIANGGQANYSGTGGEPMGCSWPGTSTTTIPGIVYFAELVVGC